MAISTPSLAASYALASQVTRQGKTLNVAPRSALAQAVRCCDTTGRQAFVDANGQTPFALEAEDPATIVQDAAEEESFEGINDHELQVEAIVERASHATNFAFDFARNVVNPQVEQVVKATQAYIDRFTQRRREPLVVEPLFNARVYDSTALQEMLTPFKDAVVTNVPAKPIAAVFPADGLRVALHTGDTGLDDLVIDHLAPNAERATTLWKSYFSDDPGNYRPSDITAAPLDADDALVLFLGANALLESGEVPDATTLDLTSYRTYLAQLREQMAARVSRLYQANVNRAKVRQLVVKAPLRAERGSVPSGTIQVSGEVYNQWLADGGSPEALYEAVHEGATLQYDVLLQDAPGLAKRWLTTMGILETQRKFERQSVMTAGLRTAMHELYLSLPDDLRHFAPYAAEGNFLAALAERLSHFHVKDLDNLYLVARKAVCRVLYPQTHAEKILNALDAVMQDHAECSPREAALLVMIDYVTEWVTDAIVINNDASASAAAAAVALSA